MFPPNDPVESLRNSFRVVETGFRRAAKDLELHLHLHILGLIPSKKRQTREAKKGARRRDEDGAADCAGCLRFAVAWSNPVDCFFQKRARKPVPRVELLACYLFENLSNLGFARVGSGGAKPVGIAEDGAVATAKEEANGLLNVDGLLSNFGFGRVDGRGADLAGVGKEPGTEDGGPVMAKEEGDVNSVQRLANGLLNVDGLLSNFGFGRVDGGGANLVSVGKEPATAKEETDENAAQKFVNGLLNIPLSNVDGLLSNLGFARVGGGANLVGGVKKEPAAEEEVPVTAKEETDGNAAQKLASGLLSIRLSNVDGLLSNLGFARVSSGGVNAVGGVEKEPAAEDGMPVTAKEEGDGNAAQKLANGLLNIPLSNVERLRSTLSTVSLAEFVEFVPLGRASREHPDKKKLFSVQDFFRYTESEGRRFFEELDRDGDGQVTLEDLEIAMRKRKLPARYARDFLNRTKRHLFSKSIGWRQFLSLMEQKEATILRAYTTLCLSKSGTLQKSQIITSLRSAGLPADEDNAVAMMRYLNAGTEGAISYSHFRNFMLLLPTERLEDDPRSIWFEAATVVAVPPPVQISAGSVLKSALAGGLSCALSTSLLHPIDTMKTRVQASTLSFPELISKLPQIGVRGLYRGSIPAILGQFSSHGLRTGIFEVSKLVLVNVAPTLAEIQIQSIASFCSTILGTAVRIPCEVLKQRLQAGIFNNVGEAIVGTFQNDGIRGFFRGTGATLCREVPFYVAGMGLYAESKKAVQNMLKRDLEPWETIAVGALSGGLAAVVTTPFDVMKTRTMTAPQGVRMSMAMIAVTILRDEGPLGLFKGAVPRFFWIAPLGAMNFAGYELARKAMDEKASQEAAATREEVKES